MLAEWISEGWLRGSLGRPEEKRQRKSAVGQCGLWGGSEPSDEKLKKGNGAMALMGLDPSVLGDPRTDLRSRSMRAPATG
jgi:hypothetical protein